MLRDSHRRRILLAVSNHNPRTEGEFTTDSFTPDETSEDEIEGLKTQLHHVHLPKMADKGYIKWHPITETIRRGPNFADIAPLLKLMDDHEDELPADWP
ncbi:DUF7344 domain-containing protein [Haladaptatus halobius]|uniref:DUF7344 domain-containing protein n=1 Tax=Haladaptatus halobius TaxID=2884875 RepID=UPI001D0BBB47|nr:transcriptional regulator [Haladaptatus halobius]